MTAEPSLRDLPSFDVHVGTLPRTGFPVRLRPDEKERAQIANACGVEGFDALEADLLVTRWRRDGVDMRGEIRATVRQQCVVTLEPVVTELREPLAMTFVTQDSRLARRDDEPSGELVLDPEGPDLPESFSGDTIDVWPVVVESLVLAIDPFPRAPGAVLEDTTGEDEEEIREDSPFAALRALKTGPKGS